VRRLKPRMARPVSFCAIPTDIIQATTLPSRSHPSTLPILSPTAVVGWTSQALRVGLGRASCASCRNLRPDAFLMVTRWIRSLLVRHSICPHSQTAQN
jgi:hypothetical protein